MLAHGADGVACRVGLFPAHRRQRLDVLALHALLCVGLVAHLVWQTDLAVLVVDAALSYYHLFIAEARSARDDVVLHRVYQEFATVQIVIEAPGT